MGISFKEVSHLYPGLKKKQFTVALDAINLDIAAEGEFVAICGKTGSGKSTLIQHMNALLLPTSGNVIVFDKVITPKKKKNPKNYSISLSSNFCIQMYFSSLYLI